MLLLLQLSVQLDVQLLDDSIKSAALFLNLGVVDEELLHSITVGHRYTEFM